MDLLPIEIISIIIVNALDYRSQVSLLQSIRSISLVNTAMRDVMDSSNAYVWSEVYGRISLKYESRSDHRSFISYPFTIVGTKKEVNWKQYEVKYDWRNDMTIITDAFDDTEYIIEGQAHFCSSILIAAKDSGATVFDHVTRMIKNYKINLPRGYSIAEVHSTGCGIIAGIALIPNRVQFICHLSIDEEIRLNNIAYSDEYISYFAIWNGITFYSKTRPDPIKINRTYLSHDDDHIDGFRTVHIPFVGCKNMVSENTKWHYLQEVPRDIIITASYTSMTIHLYWNDREVLVTSCDESLITTKCCEDRFFVVYNRVYDLLTGKLLHSGDKQILMVVAMSSSFVMFMRSK